MSVKIEELDVSKLSINNDFINYDNHVLQIQTPFFSLKPYGIQQIDMFNKTEESLMKFKVPLFNDLYDSFVKIDNYFNSKLINYTSIIKKGGDYPPYIKIKFNANTKFSLLNKEGTCEIHEFKDVKTLKSVFKFNYKIRFLFTFKKVVIC